MTVDVDFGETWFDLGGITMDSAYEVKIVCLFGGVEYACGRRVIYIGIPAITQIMKVPGVIMHDLSRSPRLRDILRVLRRDADSRHLVAAAALV